MSTIFATKYVLQYQKKYYELEWFEGELMTYIDDLKYQQCVSNPDSYFDRMKIVNFDIINNEYRGDFLVKHVKEHQSI